MLSLQIKTILPGISSSDNIRKSGEFGASLGIDPILPDTDGGIRPSGLIRPVQYAKFSDSNIDATPLFIITNPKTAVIYVILTNGKIVSYDSSLANEALAGTLTGGTAHGAEYYDNYLYIARATDIACFGPLDGSATINQDFWTGSGTRDLTLAALTNTTYPSINSITIPNHFMWRHTDGALYICNVLSSNKGSLNKIKTTKTTVEGDTNNGSEADTLDFDYGWWPVVGISFGVYVLVAFIEGTDTSIMQKPARLVLWDTVSDSFEDVTIDKNFKEPIISALQPLDDGSIMIFSGKGGTTKGCRVDRFYSLNSVQHIGYFPDLYPPLPGAVDFYAGRTAFGSGCSVPASSGCVVGIGSPLPEIPCGTHNIVKSILLGSSPMVSALKYVQQDNIDSGIIIGAKDASSYQMEKKIDSTNTSLAIKIYFDNASSNITLATINNTSIRWASKRKINIKSRNLIGRKDFYIQFEWQNGCIYRTEKEIVMNKNGRFGITEIEFDFATALPALAGSASAFLGAIELPITIKINEQI